MFDRLQALQACRYKICHK